MEIAPFTPQVGASSPNRRVQRQRSKISAASDKALTVTLVLGVVATTVPVLAQSFGEAAHFPVFNNSATVANYDTSTGLTVEAWIHVDFFNTDHGEPLRYIGSNGSPWQFMVRDAKDLDVDLIFTVGSASAVAQKVLRRGPNRPWYHIAGTYDGATIRVYVNGQLVASASQSTGVPGAGGQPSLQFSVKMECQMDEIRVWQVARSQEEIRCYMTQAVPPESYYLMFDYWNCNRCTGKFCSSFKSLITNHFFRASLVTSEAVFRIPSAVTMQTLVADSSACEGQTAVLHAGATGAPFLWYQWYRNGILMPDTPGGMRTIFPTLVIPSAEIADSGTYECVASNGCNQVTGTRHLHINSVPSVLYGPSDAVSVPGVGESFFAGVSGGGPYSYRWQRNGADLVDGGNIFGSASDTLTINPVNETDGGQYRVAIENACGSTYSEPAILTISTSPLGRYLFSDVATTATTGRHSLRASLSGEIVGKAAGAHHVIHAGFWAPRYPPGDCEANGVISLDDFAIFSDCMTGPIVDVSGGCDCADIDNNGHVDLRDAARFVADFEGP